MWVGCRSELEKLAYRRGNQAIHAIFTCNLHRREPRFKQDVQIDEQRDRDVKIRALVEQSEQSGHDSVVSRALSQLWHDAR